MTTNIRGAELHRKHVVLQQPLTDIERAELDTWYAQMDAIQDKILSSESSKANEIMPEDQRFLHESDKVGRGRLIVIAVIAIVLFFSFVTFAAGIMRLNLSAFGTVRFVLTIGLCVMLWRGHSWARWLAAVLFGLGGVVAMFVLTSPETGDQPVLGTLMLLMGIVYFVISATLVFSSDVRAFAAYQREAYF